MMLLRHKHCYAIKEPINNHMILDNISHCQISMLFQLYAKIIIKF